MTGEEFARGQIVKVNVYGGETVERRVIEDKGKTVVICNEQEYQRARKDHRNPTGIGFPRECVESK